MLPRSGEACMFWELYKEDIAIMERLGLRAFRFSIEWSRVEPRPGVFNDEAMDRYRDIVAELKGHGITPIITLHHFTNPIWFHEMGGW